MRMFRWLGFIFFTGGIAVLAAWIADHPGTVKIEWEGWGVDTTVSVLSILILIFALVVSLFYQGLLLFRRIPGKISTFWQNSRREKGYKALTKGMVAVAAGDAYEAKRNADRVNQILTDPPLSMLLSAQAAQLTGDEEAAEQFFKEMIKIKDTSFLGFRGLLSQAMKRKDYKAALGLARQAYKEKPKSPWVAEAFLKLQVRHGLWREALKTSKDMVRSNLINSEKSLHFQSALFYQTAMQSLNSCDKVSALADLTVAIKKNPGFVPAIVEIARLLLPSEKKQKVVRLIEKAWSINPHPDLALLYEKACGSDDKLNQVKNIEKLIIKNPEHPESRLLKARTAINAKLWGEARKALTGGTGELIDPDARTYSMMAELEEKEHGDNKASKIWLDSSNKVPQGPLWICSNCGNGVPKWSIFCASCECFNGFIWQQPRRVLSNSSGITSETNFSTEQRKKDTVPNRTDVKNVQKTSGGFGLQDKNTEQEDQQNAL